MIVIQAQTLIIKKQERSKSKAPNNRDKSRGKSKSRKDLICFHCNKLGHKNSKCKVFKRDQNGERSNDKKEGKNVAATVDGDVCIICHSDIINLTYQDSH